MSHRKSRSKQINPRLVTGVLILLWHLGYSQQVDACVGFRADFENFIAEGEHILKAEGLVVRVAQQRRRMEGAHHPDAVLLHPLAVLFGDFEVFVDHIAGGNAAKADDDFRLDQLDLLLEIADTLTDFGRVRVAVLRRAAFYHVADVDVAVSAQVNGCKEFVQQLSASAHKRFALCVLVCAGAFTDKHDVRMGISHAENHICAGRRKGTFLTAEAMGAEFLVIHTHGNLPFSLSYENIVA